MFVVYLKLSFNWAFWIFSNNPGGAGTQASWGKRLRSWNSKIFRVGSRWEKQPRLILQMGKLSPASLLSAHTHCLDGVWAKV